VSDSYAIDRQLQAIQKIILSLLARLINPQSADIENVYIKLNAALFNNNQIPFFSNVISLYGKTIKKVHWIS